jgi:hypothetical protein
MSFAFFSFFVLKLNLTCARHFKDQVLYVSSDKLFERLVYVLKETARLFSFFKELYPFYCCDILEASFD